MLPLVGDLDVTRARVQAPTAVVFLCGGKYTDASVSTPASLRDAFLKILDFAPLKGRDLVQAEDFTVLSLFADYYPNFLAFETDLAELTELILLFAESEGSLAELGSFVMVEEIASKLLVIVRDRHWSESSFIKLGPLRHLEQRHGETSVFVIDDDDVGTVVQSHSTIDKEVLKERLTEPVLKRLEKTRVSTLFDAARPGHITKLAVGFVQEYGALTLDEIKYLLSLYGVIEHIDRLPSLLLCAKSVGWIEEKRKGSTTYYVPNCGEQAATLYLKDSVADKNRARRRIAIREYWEDYDKLRHRAINSAMMGAAL